MANLKRNFIKGRMNKSVDERLVPNGEYIDAMNIRAGATEDDDIGSVEKPLGNIPLTTLQYIDNTPLSDDAVCIGAYQDSARETIYWFVHDPSFSVGATGKLDLVVSFNTSSSVLTYHVVSIDNGGGINTTLNFDKTFIITGVNLVEDLLFWTDDKNDPRFLNIKRSYPKPVANIDPDILEEQLMVVKRPPLESPSIENLVTGSDENYIKDRMICFAYRYRYADNDYSATSQWTSPAFIPSPFDFSFSSSLNEGMVNRADACIITFNSGSQLVKGIDLLFKDADGDVIHVIEKLDKEDEGYVDNTDYTFTFDNSKIFTVIPTTELLRMYDNVPLKAKAQTVMGNRLVYGNYTEGRDLIDLNGNKIRIEYEVDLLSTEIGLFDLPVTYDTGAYGIGSIVNNIANSIIQIDLTGQSLTQGSSITIELTITHSLFDGNAPFPTEQTENVELVFDYILPQDFSSVYALATSQDFIDKVGEIPVLSVANSCSGGSFTDRFNCQIPQNLDALEKFESGINNPSEPIAIITAPSSDVIGLQLPAMRFVDDTAAPTQSVYEYYEVANSIAFYQMVSNPKSLHSNRGYEVGILYMDDFNRATTALVSENNFVRVPCDASDKQNQIQVTIPDTQVAPSWATRYKFVIKSDESGYDTIYSTLFFLDPSSNDVYFYLDGENAAKVSVGDRLVVKKDTSGSMQTCTYATVLDKSTQPEGFLTIPSEIDPTDELYVPAGVYMKIRPNDFSAVSPENAFISYGEVTVNEDDAGQFPILSYPMYIEVGGVKQNYDVPAGSIIKIDIKFSRLGVGQGNGSCERREYSIERTFVSTANYANMKDWWEGDNIDVEITKGTSNVGLGGCPIDNHYDSTLLTDITLVQTDLCTNYYQFYSNNAVATGDPLVLVISGTRRCNGFAEKKKRRSSITARIDVFRADTLLVFETEPSNSLPDIFYESDESFAINQATGEHSGNVQDQDFAISQPAIVETSFYNCYAFGNGVESYKIRDSIKGRFFVLGNRATSTSGQDYREIRRFADLTYSGIYNNETNVNRLNEFNLGLSNFKNCEISFGDIQIVDGRKTDVLVLQEDKISYVLAGKNLLSDAVGGGDIASVPEVLGTQVARSEEYGISSNPESYVKWGYDKFFTDAKRGVVLQLRGDSYGSESLSVISNAGMSEWFRDLFIESFDKQKLGAYDPYIEEYVLASNNETIPQEIECDDCGIEKTLSLISDQPIEYCVNLGNPVGEVQVFYNVISIDPEISFAVTATYDGVQSTSGAVNSSGSFTLSKSTVTPSDIDISVVANGGNAIIELQVGCPQGSEITLVEVCITSDEDAGKFITNEHRWYQGTYFSPKQSALVTFQSGVNPVVSRYVSATGQQGVGQFPVDGSTVRLISNKLAFDNFQFDEAVHKFRYLRSNTLYSNTAVDIQALVAASSTATPIDATGAPDKYFADFAMPASGSYIYLIWDYRNTGTGELCYSDVGISDVCCDCGECQCTTWLLDNSGFGPMSVSYTDCYGNASSAFVQAGFTQSVCSQLVPTITSGSGNIFNQGCGCNVGVWLVKNCVTGVQLTVSGAGGFLIGDIVSITNNPDCLYEIIDASTLVPSESVENYFPELTCAEVCGTYDLLNESVDPQTLSYIDCNGDAQTLEIPSGITASICARALENGELFSILRIACGCDPAQPYFEVTRCGDDLVLSVDDNGVGAIVGDFVRLTGDTDCLYEVTATTASVPVNTISEIDNDFNCDTVCKSYQLSSVDPAAVDIDYVDCDGLSITVTLNPLSSLYICARTVTPPASQDVTISFYDCGCNTPSLNWIVRKCGELTLKVTSSPTPLTVGQFVVLVGEPSCLYEVINTSSAIPITNVASISSSNCSDFCSTWAIANSSGSDQVANYTDCAGLAGSITVPTGRTYYVCARSVDSSVSYTVTWYDCGCNLETFSLELTRCADSQIFYAYDNGSYVVGQFVTTVEEPDCRYEITANATAIPTLTVAALSARQDCIDNCTTWYVTNPTGASITIPYTDCAGSGASITLVAGDEAYVCAREINAPAQGGTQAFHDCGCNQPAFLFTVERCGDGLSKTVSSGGLTVSPGDIVQLLGDPDCQYAVIGSVTGTATDTMTSVLGGACSDYCSTWVLDNTDVVARDVTYEDCSGVSQTITIPPGQIWEVCANELLVLGAGVTGNWQACGCNPSNFSYELRRCGDNRTAIAYDTTGTIVAGDTVIVDGEPDCRYTVISGSTLIPTVDVITKTAESGCTETCSTYLIEEIAGSDQTVNYLDCSGVLQSETVIANGSLYVCARTVFRAVNYTVSFAGCGCNIPNYTYTIEDCRLGTSFTASSDVAVTIGDIVNVLGDDCKYEVIAATNTVPTKVITSIAPEATCADVCTTYGVLNETGAIQTITYTDCDGVARVAEIPTGQNWNVCATTLSVSGGITPVKSACGCNPSSFSLRAERCGDNEVIYIYRYLGYVIGDLITTSEDGCIYWIKALSSELPTADPTGLASEANCGEVCNTWKITELTGSSNTFTWTPCVGAPEVFTASRSSVVYLCAKDIVFDPALFSVEFYACGCNVPNQSYGVTLCEDISGSETYLWIYSPIGSISMGDLVKIDTTNLFINKPELINCYFEVTSVSISVPRIPVTEIAPEGTTCADVCVRYNVVYSSGSGTLVYTDCNGNASSVFVPDDGAGISVCAKGFPLGRAGFSITVDECNCR